MIIKVKNDEIGGQIKICRRVSAEAVVVVPRNPLDSRLDLVDKRESEDDSLFCMDMIDMAVYYRCLL